MTSEGKTPDEVELRYTLTPSERRALSRRLYWLVRPSPWPRLALALAMGGVLFVLFALLERLVLGAVWPVVMLLAVLLPPELRVRAAVRNQLATLEKPETHLVLKPNGLSTGDDQADDATELRWQPSTRLVRWRRFTLIHLDAVRAVAIPDRAFRDDAHREQVLASIQAHLGAVEPVTDALSIPVGYDERVYEHTLTLDDHIDLQRWVWLRRTRRRALLYVVMGLASVCTGVFTLQAQARDDLAQALVALMATSALLTLAALPLWYPLRLPGLVRTFAARQPDLYPTLPTRCGLGPEGVFLATERGQTRFGRDTIVDVHRVGERLYLELIGTRFVILPDHAVPPPSWGLNTSVPRGDASDVENPFAGPSGR